MPKVKFDVSGSDPAKAKGFTPPPPGVYTAKVEELKPGFKKGDDDKPDKSAPRLEVVVRITKGPHKGAPLYDYIPFSEAMQWKMDQFLQVFGIATDRKRKGEFKTEDIVGLPVKIKVRGATYNGDYKAELGAYLEASDEDILDEDEEEELDESEEEELDEEEEDEAEDEEDEEEEDEDESEEDEEAEGYSEDDLKAMDLNTLNEVLAEYGESAPKSFKGKSAKIARILEIQPEALGGESDDEEEDEEGDDYADMDRATLAAECKSRSIKVLKADDEDKLRAKLRADDEADPFS